MPDKYGNFAELAEDEREGVDFRVRLKQRNLTVAIIAPHGGKIEPGTSEITEEIAGTSYSSYFFEGLVDHQHCHFHITSTNFDEPKCLNLIRQCNIVIAVHGLDGQDKAVEVGGRDEKLRNAICANLKTSGFVSKVVTTGNHAAISQKNICNKGQRGAGVQLEITRGLRDALLDGTEDLSAFVKAVQQALP